MSVRDYLPALIDEIVTNFPNGRSVTVVKKIDEFVLDAKILQPLGIIINELLTNCMKYAFTGMEGGRISVLVTEDSGRVLLTIQDNGTGILGSADFANSSGFGIQLIHMLAQQLRGSIRFERGDGTTAILEFEI
jgi:two-component sensor histidine kinase